MVSVGGGAGEAEFFQSWLPALEALREQELGCDGALIALCGPMMDEGAYRELQAEYHRSPNVIVKRYSCNFQQLMDEAALSISRCGYNTTYNILRSKSAAMVIPASHHIDQRIRACGLELSGAAHRCENDVGMQERMDRISNALHSPVFERCIRTDGAARTRQEVARLYS